MASIWLHPDGFSHEATFAEHLLGAGTDIRYIQQRLGIGSILYVGSLCRRERRSTQKVVGIVGRWLRLVRYSQRCRSAKAFHGMVPQLRLHANLVFAAAQGLTDGNQFPQDRIVGYRK